MSRGIVTTMQLVGAEDLVAALRELPERLAKNTLDRALKKVAQPIADAAQAKVLKRTGKTQAKIIVSKQLSRRQRAQQGEKDSKWVRVVYVGVRPSSVAHLIEFGTGERHWTGGGDKRRRAGRMALAAGMGGKSTGRMPPHPYLRPAWDAGKGQALDQLGVILGQEIEASARRLAKRLAKKA